MTIQGQMLRPIYTREMQELTDCQKKKYFRCAPYTQGKCKSIKRTALPVSVKLRPIYTREMQGEENVWIRFNGRCAPYTQGKCKFSE